MRAPAPPNPSAPQRFLFLLLGYVEADRPGISGGDVRWLKFAVWLLDQGHQVTVLSTDNCRNFIDKYDRRIGFVSAGNLGPMDARGGLRRVLRALTTWWRLRRDYDVIYSCTSLLFDVLPGFFLKLFARRKWVVVCHWVAPLRGRQTSFLSGLLFYLGDRAGLLLSALADRILCVSKPTLDKVLRFPFIRQRRAAEVDCGVDLKLARSADYNPGTIHGAHIKRIAKTKGSFDLPRIWKLVTERIPEAKLVICGDGSTAEVQTLQEIIRETGMEKQITYLGPIYDDVQKYGILRAAPCFLLPSYEENWAIVIGEALAAGAEVVCYDLPDIRPVWGDSLHWVPVGDLQAFAETVCQILRGQASKKHLPPPAALKSWDQVYERELHLMLQPA